jgi:hypothetical protein
MPTWWLWLAVCILLSLLRALRLRGLLLLGLSHALRSQAGACLLKGWGTNTQAQEGRKKQVRHRAESMAVDRPATAGYAQAVRSNCATVNGQSGSAALLAA